MIMSEKNFTDGPVNGPPDYGLGLWFSKVLHMGEVLKLPMPKSGAQRCWFNPSWIKPGHVYF